MRAARRGQVLVLFAVLITVLLAFAGLAIDIGRQVAERRHVQTAADAGALAACRELTQGASDAAAALAGRQVALANLEGSPSGATATIAPDNARVFEDGHYGDPAFLVSGIVVAGTSVRLAISADVPTTLARVVGIGELDTGARARCELRGMPAMPIVARRYDSPPGPGHGFTDFLASEATSGSGTVDLANPLGYSGRTPASESQPGPVFELYGPNSKANNDSSFRGFIALDVRNFESISSRVYYNGVYAGMTENTLKKKEGDYILSGYPGPGFPPVSVPATGATQVGVMSGNDTSMVVGNFEDVSQAGDRMLLAVYDGTVMEIPDFAITPPSEITLPSDGGPVDGLPFTVSRNDAFFSTVELHMHGDSLAPDPAYDLLPDPPVSPPAAGTMTEPTWSANNFTPDKKGTKVDMTDFTTNTIPAGIYTVWLEGHSGNPYYQTRRAPIAVRVNGDGGSAPDIPVARDFSLGNSDTYGSATLVGGPINLNIVVSTTNNSSTRWGAPGDPVSLTWDTGSLTTCSLSPVSIPSPSQISFSNSSVVPSGPLTGGTTSILTIDTSGLSSGCYTFVVRATGMNGDGQPVTHLLPITFTVATSSSNGQYVDIIGFAVFQVTDVTANSITGRAVTGIHADPNDLALRRAQTPRLTPWN